MGRMGPILVHAHLLQRIVHTMADHGACDAQIFGRKGHVLLHHVGNDLVVGVLEDHAHAAPDGDQQLLVGGVHAVDMAGSAAGQQNGIEMLGKGRLARAVGAQDGNEAALLDLQIEVFKDLHALSRLQTGIAVGEIFYLDRRHMLPPQSGVQRPAAPQGSMKPVDLTGRPSSPLVVFPPNLAVKTVSDT